MLRSTEGDAAKCDCHLWIFPLLSKVEENQNSILEKMDTLIVKGNDADAVDKNDR